MRIDKIGNNKYKVYIEAGKDALGKRRRKAPVVNAKNESEARKKGLELEREYYHAYDLLSPENITFSNFSEMFIKKYCKENIEPVTLEHYEFLLERINPIIGGYKLEKITSFLLDNMYDEIKYKNKNKPLSANSMLHYYRLINTMFNQAIKWGFINDNPNKKTQKPKAKGKKVKFYNGNQVNKLNECLKNECLKYQAIITLALDLGIRRGEIVALMWDDINFDTNEVVIDNSLKVVKGKADERRAKTENSNRTIYMANTTKDILKQYKQEQDEYIKEMGKNWHGTGRVFTSKDGSYMYPSTPYKIITKIMRKYNLDDITFHGLRHTSATLLLENGQNAKAVCDRLGHANPTITLGIYAHTTDDAMRKSANIMDNILKNC